MNGQQRLNELSAQFADRSLPDNLARIIEAETGVTLDSAYLDIPLKNPVIVAPGQLTLNIGQIKSIRRAGYAGCVLKSVVGESPDQACSMSAQRKKSSYINTFFEPEDTEGAHPIIHWDGRCDVRSLADYIPFAHDAIVEHTSGYFVVIASLLCHLPFPGEDIRVDEWLHSTKSLLDAGFTHIEIDFCPFLAGDNYTEDQENVLRWYRECTALIKSVSPRIRVFPKILNLDWGLEFQARMAESSVAGGADGVVVANRIYKHEYRSGHGGEELRMRNLNQVRFIKTALPNLAVSATGGVYSGRHIFDYLKAGAENVQLLSYLMGKVNRPFPKVKGNRFEKVIHKLLLDPDDGLIACILKEGAI